MSRNRHASKKTSIPVPVPSSESPIRRENWIDPFTGQDLETKLIQIFIDSAGLAEEPEFLDLEFDRNKIIEVTNRHFRKNEKRLEAAQKKGDHVLRAVFDDVNIEIAAELITPGFRSELQKRLQALNARVQREKDLKKLQIIAVLETGSKSNTFPLSSTGLILKIYGRTFNQARQDHQEEKALMDRMKAEFSLSEKKPQEILDIVGNPEKLKVVETELGKNPRLLQRLETQVSDRLDAFEKELGSGRLDLALFTLDEITLPFDRLEARHGDAGQFFDTSKETARELVFVEVKETLAEIFTPERWQKFYLDMQSTAREWVTTRHPWGTALHAEMGLLDKEQYTQSPFVSLVFFGQLGHLAAPKNNKLSKKRR